LGLNSIAQMFPLSGCLWTVLVQVVAAKTGLFESSLVVLEIEPAFFESVVLSSNRTWVMMFYTNHCEHCRVFAPKYANIAEKFGHDDRVNFGAMDCASCRNFCMAMGVERFPYLIDYHMPEIPVTMARGGQAMDIWGASLDGAVIWVQDYLRLEKNWTARLAKDGPKATPQSVKKLREANRKAQSDKQRERREHERKFGTTTLKPLNNTEYNAYLLKAIDDEWRDNPVLQQKITEKMQMSKDEFKNTLLRSYGMRGPATPAPPPPRVNRSLPPQEIGMLKPARAAGLCLTSGSSLSEDVDEAFAEVQTCDGSRQQIWYFRKYQLVNAASKKCLQEGPTTGGEQKILLKSCDGLEKSEKFTWFWDDQHLRNGVDDKCMQTSMARKGRVQMGHCYGGSSQKWVLKPETNGSKSTAEVHDDKGAAASLAKEGDAMFGISSHMLWFVIGWITLCGIVLLMRKTRGRSTKFHESPKAANVSEQDNAGHSRDTLTERRNFDA